jgi:hypothetical protein
MSSEWTQRLVKSVLLAMAMGVVAALVIGLMGGPPVSIGVSVGVGALVGRIGVRR